MLNVQLIILFTIYRLRSWLRPLVLGLSCGITLSNCSAQPRIQTANIICYITHRIKQNKKYIILMLCINCHNFSFFHFLKDETHAFLYFTQPQPWFSTFLSVRKLRISRNMHLVCPDSTFISKYKILHAHNRLYIISSTLSKTYFEQKKSNSILSVLSCPCSGNQIQQNPIVLVKSTFPSNFANGYSFIFIGKSTGSHIALKI